MEVYFNVHEVTRKQNIVFARLKLEGHALKSWESDAVSKALGNESLVINWEVLKNMIKSQFYPIGYEEHQQIVWNYFKHRQGKSMQEFTTEFRKRAIHMGVSLQIPHMLVKYLGALLPQICRQLMLFRPKTIDVASIQTQYVEGDKRSNRQILTSK
jgi:hypothetical protein